MRLLFPLAIVALATAAPTALASFQKPTRSTRIALGAAVLTSFALMLAARGAGNAAAWLSGDPLVALLAFPAAQGAPSGPIAIFGLLVLLLSGKRLALVAWAIGLAVFISVQSGMRRVVAVAALGLAALSAGAAVAALGYADGAVARIRSIPTSPGAYVTSGHIGVDPSLSQRIEEGVLTVERLRLLPLFPLVGGAQEYFLTSGHSTKAIHNAPLFLLSTGGIAWVFALLGWVSRYPSRHSMPAALRAAAIIVLVESFGANLALSPSFGIALAALLVRKGG